MGWRLVRNERRVVRGDAGDRGVEEFAANQVGRSTPTVVRYEPG